MAIRKFENLNIIKKNKNIKLSKEEKQKLKLENKAKRKELKELRKEDKKILNSNRKILPFLDVNEDDSFITKDGFLDIYQIESHDIYSFSNNETQIFIYNFIRFLRYYSEDFKIISMNFPVNTIKQQEYIREKIIKTNNEIYKQFLQEKLEQFMFLEEHRTNKEFFLMIFAKTYKEKEDLINNLFSNQNKSVQLKNLSLEKKLKILFKLNNPNTKLIS